MSTTSHRIELSVKVLLAIAVAYLCIPGVRDIGSQIERRASPIVDGYVVTKQVVSPDTFCWTMEFNKLKTATVGDWAFRIDTEEGESGPFMPSRLDGSTLNLRQPRPAGSHNVIDYCVTLPMWVQPGERFSISGHFKFLGFLDLWWVPYEIPVMSTVRPKSSSSRMQNEMHFARTMLRAD